MIDIKNVSKWYGSFQVLTDCSTRVAKGEVVCIIGPSGSGKSTLIRCINHLETIKSGRITVDGTALTDSPVSLARSVKLSRPSDARSATMRRSRSSMGLRYCSMEPTPRLLLLDSASLYFRAFFGVPDRRSRADVPINAVTGFLDMIATLVDREKPTDLVCCWDNDWRPAFRVEAIPSYKTHRLTEGSDVQEESPENLTPQVPIIRDVLAAIGLTRLGVDGYEADDVIGTLVQTHLGRMPVDVVTGDRVLVQLVDDAQDVRVLYTAKGGVREPDIIDQSFLQAKYGVATGAGYADMAALRGDTSDGLPGVPGVGEVAVVSGGDAGVFGMASAVFEAVEHAVADDPHYAQVPVQVYPGVSAAQAAAAKSTGKSSAESSRR